MTTVLLVEDTSHLAEEIADILRLEGYHVKTISNALIALNKLEELKPDIIITDLLMPIMDGFQFIQQVRTTASFKTIPIVILSAKTSPEDKAHGLAVGANAFIQKPCKAHELVATLESCFNNQ